MMTKHRGLRLAGTGPGYPGGDHYSQRVVLENDGLTVPMEFATATGTRMKC